jgi:uncharacterized protein YcbK (DUF882 family)
LPNEMDGFTPQVQDNLIALCQKMEQVRTILIVPINVHCGFRSQEYNKEVLKSLPADVHSFGQAIDFDCLPHLTIDQTKQLLLPHLDKLGIRLEKGTSTWVHLDIHQVGPSGRYFTA